ncbi:MAG TPA: hypothetical protein VF821_30335 [Lentzea sp.]
MIKGWKRPDLEPGPLKSLNDALHDLHARSGYRSSREIEKWIRADQGTGGISHTTVHKLFTSAELPRPELMHWVVKVLLDHSRVPDPDQVHDEFDALWNAAFDAQQEEQRLLRAKQRKMQETQADHSAVGPVQLSRPLDPVVAFVANVAELRGGATKLLARFKTAPGTDSMSWGSSPRNL